MSFYDDHDLLREAREDRRREEPDPAEWQRITDEIEAVRRERESAPIGTRLARKKAA